MCEQAHSESGALVYIIGCNEFNLIASERDRLAGVVLGMEEQNARNLAALNKENVVMRRQMERLSDERDALLKVREAADALASKVYGMFQFGSALNGTHAGFVREAVKAYKEARDGIQP